MLEYISSLSCSCIVRKTITALLAEIPTFLSDFVQNSRKWCWRVAGQYWPATIHCERIASLLTISGPFHSLFKVLFIFRSLYLFAIGLSPVFSLRWNLPPALGCDLKQPDSVKTHVCSITNVVERGCHPLWRGVPTDLDDINCRKRLCRLQFRLANPDRFQPWAPPASLAVTEGILVSFFSSAYLYA